MREVKIHSESDHEIVNINDHSAERIYAFWKHKHTGIHVYHTVMIQTSSPRGYTRNRFCFIDSAGAMIDGMSPGESNSGLYQSEVHLIHDMMKQGCTVYEFESDREFREWAGGIERDEEVEQTLTRKAW